MRGADSYNESLFTKVRLESFVPANHPLRPILTRLRHVDQHGCRFFGGVRGLHQGWAPSIAPAMRSASARESASTSASLGDGDRATPPGHGAGAGQGRSGADLDHDGLQLHAAAHFGATASDEHQYVEMVGSDRINGCSTAISSGLLSSQMAA